jgi:hypothetical protein
MARFALISLFFVFLFLFVKPVYSTQSTLRSFDSLVDLVNKKKGVGANYIVPASVDVDEHLRRKSWRQSPPDYNFFVTTDNKTEYESNKPFIPRIIWQFLPSLGVVGSRIREAIMSWSSKNTEFDWVVLTDDVAGAYAEKFLSHATGTLKPFLPFSVKEAKAMNTSFEVLDNMEAVKLFVPNGQCASVRKGDSMNLELTQRDIVAIRSRFMKLKGHFVKSHLLRLMLLFEHGGLFFEPQSVCQKKLIEWLSPDASFVTSRGMNGDPLNWGIIASPQHPFILGALKVFLEHSHDDSRKLDMSMTDQWWFAVKSVLCDERWSLPAQSGMQIFKEDMFNHFGIDTSKYLTFKFS